MKALVAIIGVLHLATAWAGAAGAAQFPFQVGEKLTYQMYWGPFVVGRASLEVRGIEQVDGRDCYHFVARAKTSGFAELLYPVDSTTESWFDTEQLCARRYRQKRREGRHRREDETVYDYAKQEAVVRNFLTGKEKRLPLTQPVQDVLSAVYFVRSRPLKLNEPQKFVINASDNNYKVTIAPDERKSLWVRPVGEVPALRIEPNPTLKIVASNNGRMWFWVSDDARRLPLIVMSNMKMGNAKLVLAKVESSGLAANEGAAGRPATAALSTASATALATRH
jgi:hypothetical protein